MVPVVAISGFPGSGKTTLTRRLAAYFGVPAVFYDDHEQVTSQPPSAIRDWIARGSKYDEIDLTGMIAAIHEASKHNPPFILLDTLLGRAHQASNEIINLSLWLDAPADIALVRQMGDAARRAVGAEQARDFARWVDAYSRHYEEFIVETYAAQADRVKGRADKVLTQWRDNDLLLREAVDAVKAAGISTSQRPSILSAMERFGAGFGYEKSIKLSPGEINDDRYITSVHRDDLGDDPAATISSVMDVASLPKDQWLKLMELLPEADVIHFGHEGGGDPVRKIYLEFVSNMRKAAKAGSRDPLLLYLALKWRPGSEGRAAFNRYILAPQNQIPAQMIRTMRKGYGSRTDAVSLWLGSETVRLAASRAGENGLLFAEVEEEGTGRFSYDVATYNAQIFGREMAHLFAPMFEAYGVPSQAAAAIQQRIDDQQIGHISVGVGRDGRDFVTIYFGVEARAPAHV